MLWYIVIVALFPIPTPNDGYPLGNVTSPKTVMAQFLVSVNKERIQTARDVNMRIRKIVEDVKLTEKALEFSKSCPDLDEEEDYVYKISQGFEVPSEALNPFHQEIGCAFNYNCTENTLDDEIPGGPSRTLCLFHSPHDDVEDCAFGVLKRDDHRIFCNPPPTAVPNFTVPKFVTACLMFSLFFCFMFGFGVLNHMIEIHNMRR